MFKYVSFLPVVLNDHKMVPPLQFNWYLAVRMAEEVKILRDRAGTLRYMYISCQFRSLTHLYS